MPARDLICGLVAIVAIGTLHAIAIAIAPAQAQTRAGSLDAACKKAGWDSEACRTAQRAHGAANIQLDLSNIDAQNRQQPNHQDGDPVDNDFGPEFDDAPADNVYADDSCESGWREDEGLCWQDW